MILGDALLRDAKIASRNGRGSNGKLLLLLPILRRPALRAILPRKIIQSKNRRLIGQGWPRC